MELLRGEEDSSLLKEEILKIGERARLAAQQAVRLSSKEKNQILESMAVALEEEQEVITRANKEDLLIAEQEGLSKAFCDRLLLNSSRFNAMVQGLRELILLSDPVGEIIKETVRPNGLVIKKVRVPIGVIAVIYESRPNVTADSAGLCLKASNSVILRGGKESLRTNAAITEALVHGGKRAGMPDGMVQLVNTASRKAVKHLVQLENKVDLVIPRGGESLIRAVVEMARVPVLKHYKGVCHLYIDKTADFDWALKVTENAKCQRPGVCNSIETLLVHRDIADRFLPQLAKQMAVNHCELRGDEEVCSQIPGIKKAEEDDWYTEYLDLILAVKVVSSVNEAVEHINQYGSKHTDGIIAEDPAAQDRFALNVDSGVVMINASTRFNDGGEFGLGAEIGISTDKLHARGPVGVEELCTYKYVVIGAGQTR